MSSDLLPIELIAKIVECAHIDSDVQFLQASALVSKAWHFASRPYVFYSVTLTGEARLVQFEELLERDPGVCSFVRTLVIRHVSEPVASPSPWLARIVDTLPDTLFNVSSVRLIGLCDFGTIITQAFVERFARFAQAEHLSIDASALNLALVIALAAALPRVRDLHVGPLLPLPLLPSAPDDAPVPQLHPPRLRSLHQAMGEMYPHGMRDFHAWLLGTPTRGALRVLRIVVTPMNMGPAGAFITELGPQLEELDLELTIRLPAPVEAEVVRYDISLRTCTALRALTLRHHTALSRTTLALLAEVPAPRVRSLTLGVLAAADEAALPDFAPLQAHLPPAWMASLTEERVLYAGPLPAARVLAKMRRDLPALHAHGTLKVVRV